MQEARFDWNLGMMVRRNARHYPNKLAIVVGDTRLTYGQFNQRVNRTANALLGLGLQKGDKVGMLLPNSIEMLELFWACAKAGTVIVPLNPMVKGRDLIRLLQDCEARALIFSAEYSAEVAAMQPELSLIKTGNYISVGGDNSYVKYDALVADAPSSEPDVEIGEYDHYNIMYSSGTTGLPKGIIHTHRTRIMYAFLWGMEYGVTFDSVVLSAGNLVFNGTLAFMFPAICAGATYVVLPKWSAEIALNAIQNERVTQTMLVPSQIIQILESPEFDKADISSLKVLMTLGSPLAVERKRQLEARLPGVLYELYGLTEGFMTTLRPQDVMRKLGSVGPAMPFNEFMIMDDNLQPVPTGEVGEVLGCGPTLMPGYYNNPDATEAAIYQGKWMRTGDLGWQDEDGFIYLVDRKKDMIKSGGISVYPRDIEEVVATHPLVSEVAVFGVPHPKWDEVPVAQIILKADSKITEEEMLTWINENVNAKFQRLHGVKFVETFPRNAAGKTLKRLMRDEYKNQ